MQRILSYALKAHPKLEHDFREQTIVSSFLLGLHYQKLVMYFAAVKPSNAQDAQRLAFEIEAVRRDQRSRRTVSGLLP